MSKFELGLHLSLLIDKLRKTESQPDTFDTSDAIARLLAGEDPAAIFQQKIKPFLTTSDLEDQYSIQHSRFFKHNWKKKALVNTLRSAACMSIKDKLLGYQLQSGLPVTGLNGPNTWPVFFARRAVEITETVENFAESLNASEPNTRFEQILTLLNGYLHCDLPSAKEKILYRVGEEATGVSQRLLPAYFRLIYSVFNRDKNNFSSLKDSDLSLDLYQQLCMSSQAVFLKGAITTVGGMSAYFDKSTKYVGLGNLMLLEESFELVESSKKTGDSTHYLVRLKPDVARKVKEAHKKKNENYLNKVMNTQCPAMTRDRHTGETKQTTEAVSDLNFNLLQTLLHNSVFG